MAKERNLPSKTTLTTSDYIRVVGSDNASYKQNVSSVMETMGLKYDDLGSVSTQSALETALNTKLDAMPTNSTGYLRFSASASFGVFQSGVAYICELRKGGSATYASISLHGLGINAEVVGNKASATWTFQKEPTRAEIDSLNSNTAYIKSTGVSVDNQTDLRTGIVSAYNSVTADPLLLQIAFVQVSGTGRFVVLIHKNSANYGSAVAFGYGAIGKLYSITCTGGTLGTLKQISFTDV